MSTLQGFRIFEDSFAPATGRWRAVRYGVSLSAGTRDALVRMIIQKGKDDAEVQRRQQDQGRQCDKILRHNVTRCVTFLGVGA